MPNHRREEHISPTAYFHVIGVRIRHDFAHVSAVIFLHVVAVFIIKATPLAMLVKVY